MMPKPLKTAKQVETVIYSIVTKQIMHIHFFLLFLTTVTISGLATDVSKAAGSGSVLAGSALAGEMKPAEALADFDLMRALLEEAHAGLYRYSTKAEMDRTFDGQRAKL